MRDLEEARRVRFYVLRPSAGFAAMVPPMIAPETHDHIELIKKRAGHLWRFL
jgi:hypothetical protein